MLKLHGPKMICLCIVVFIVDLCLTAGTSLYLVHQDKKIEKDVQFTYRNAGDTTTVVHRTLLIGLCIRFMIELLQGSVTNEDLEDLSDEFIRLKVRPHYTWCEKMTYFFKKLELNQFTIPSLLAATHELYCGVLLFIAVYCGQSKWYIVTAFGFILGAFSIPIPGICFHQLMVYKKLHQKTDMKSQYDEGKFTL